MPGGDGAPGIVGPGMLRVTAAHLLFHLGIDLIPEVAQILGDRQRTARRREEMEDDGYSLTADTGILAEAGEFL
jgi:hypothetical protein